MRAVLLAFIELQLAGIIMFKIMISASSDTPGVDSHITRTGVFVRSFERTPTLWAWHGIIFTPIKRYRF